MYEMYRSYRQRDLFLQQCVFRIRRNTSVERFYRRYLNRTQYDANENDGCVRYDFITVNYSRRSVLDNLFEYSP